MEIGLLLVWVVCGILGGFIAAKWGRNAAGWGILCLVFGVLGLIALGVAGPSPDTRRCPECTARIFKVAKKCRHCGSAVEAVG